MSHRRLRTRMASAETRRVLETPIGGVEIRTDGRRLKELNLTHAAPTAREPRDALQEELDRYFRGEPVTFADVEVDLSGFTEFERAVYRATRAIPFGKVATYGQIAKAIGRPNAPRAVGQALGKNPTSIVIPCHRVVASDGGLGGFTGGLHWKRKLLRLEGVLP